MFKPIKEAVYRYFNVVDPKTGEVGHLKIPVLNEDGHEVPDPTPVALPIGFTAPEGAEDRILRLIKENMAAINRAAAQAGYETFDEADDFDTGEDDDDPFSPHEVHFDHVTGKEINYHDFMNRDKVEYLKRQALHNLSNNPEILEQEALKALKKASLKEKPKSKAATSSFKEEQPAASQTAKGGDS